MISLDSTDPFPKNELAILQCMVNLGSFFINSFGIPLAVPLVGFEVEGAVRIALFEIASVVALSFP